MKFILGKKLEMTQVFQPDGTVVPATKVLAGPCLVVQKKTQETDGYRSISCAFENKKKVNKPLLGIFKKFSDSTYTFIKEFRFTENDEMFDKIKVGDNLKIADVFNIGDIIEIQGTSKGKGFQGVVKRHGFKGGKASHGHKDQLRMPGSVGATGPARVFKGMRMGGQTGDDLITVKGLEIIDIEPQTNILYLKGAVPGARNSLIKMITDGKFEITKSESVKEEQSASVETEKKDEAKPQENTVAEKTEEKKSDELKNTEKKPVSADDKKIEEVKDKKVTDEKNKQETK